jgi:hypothetical protein
MSNKRSTFLLIILLLCLSTQFIQAQADGASLLATYLDQHASANGLPSGDGAISSVEQTLATTLIDEVTGFSQAVTEFEQSSPANAALVENVDQGFAQLEQEIVAAPTFDARAQIISEVVAQYEPEMDAVQASGTFDARAMIISEAVDEYSRYVDSLKAEAPLDPRAEAISSAVDEYSRYVDSLKAQQPLDPRAEAVAHAVAQYGIENGHESVNGDTLGEGTIDTITNAASQYIDGSNVARKNIAKRHIRKLIDDEFSEIPEERLDSISGIYSFGPNEVSYSGDCDDEMNGENGGTDRDAFTPEDPMFQVHVCFSYTYGIMMLDSEVMRWFGDGTPNTYQSEVIIDSFDNTSRQKIATIIDETAFDVTQVSSDGTCTRTSTTHYELYVGGSMFGCNPNSKVWSVGGEPVDIKTGNPPAEEEEVIIDPIIAGEYAVSWMPFDPTCDQEYAPTFNTVGLTPVSFDEVKLTINGQTYSFGGSGMNEGMNGSFDMYQDTVSGGLNRRLSTDFDFYWQASSEDYSESCSAQGLLTLGTAAADQPVFNPPVAGGQDDDQIDTGTTVDPDIIGTPVPFTAPESGTYNASAMLMPGMGCPADVEATLPQITQVTLDVASDELIFNVGAEQYTLPADPAGYTFYEFNEDNSGLAVSVSGVMDGVIYASYTVYTPDSNICMLSLTLSQ